MLAAIVCERMHWSYETYQSQPVWLVDLLLSKWEIDAKNAERQQRSMR